MSKIQHPIRTQEFVYYKHAGGPTPNIKREWVGFFSDYQNYPMYFHGSSYEECRDRAVAFQNSAADKHEKEYLMRIESLRKAREAKKKK
jgi:hypothetical protein